MRSRKCKHRRTRKAVLFMGYICNRCGQALPPLPSDLPPGSQLLSHGSRQASD